MTSSTTRRSSCAADVHGDRKAYDLHRCRCPDATADHARYERIRRTEQLLGRPRLVSATGTRRRVEALFALGWPSDELGVKLGYTDGFAVRKLRRRALIRRTTACRVASLYDRLADSPGPSIRVARWAHAAGMLPPLWWDDDTIDDPSYQPSICERARRRTDVDVVIVERLADGVPVDNPTPAERFAAFQRLLAAGAAESHIIERLHLSWDTLASYRRRVDAAGIATEQVAA